jgi:hypothetical protein
MVKRHFVPILAISVVFLTAFCGIQLALSGQTGQNETEEVTPIKVTARLDRNVITIGDKIKYELTVEAQPGVEFSFPQFGENLGGFAIKDFGHVPEGRKRDGTVVASQWYVLDTYLTGTYEIPPAPFRYKLEGQDREQTIYAPQLAVLVESLLEKEGQPTDIRDIKDPVELPADRTKVYAAAGLALAAVGAGLALVFLLKRRRRRFEIESVEMPWETALKELVALRSFDPAKEGRIEEFYVALSGVVRHYLERRFGLRAPEMTTEEFFELMSRNGTLVQEHKELVREFLAHCDLVKFARYGPSREEIDGAYGAALRLVKETVPQETEEPTEVGEEGG